MISERICGPFTTRWTRARTASFVCPFLLATFAVLPTDSLAVWLGVPLRLASGRLAAMGFDACGRGGSFADYVLRADGVTPLLVVPECAGLGKFLLLLAVASVLAASRRIPGRMTCLLLVAAAALAVFANAIRLLGVAWLVPTVASRTGALSLVHEALGLVPFGLAILVLRGLSTRLASNASSAWRSARLTFPLGVSIAALALLPLRVGDDLAGPSLRARLERSGLSTRVVDARIDESGRAFLTVEGFGDGRTVLELERFETMDGLRSWPDLYAARFARLAEPMLPPIRRVIVLDP